MYFDIENRSFAEANAEHGTSPEEDSEIEAEEEAVHRHLHPSQIEFWENVLLAICISLIIKS